MNESRRPELSIDPRTGIRTAVVPGRELSQIREACQATNSGRTRGILEAAFKTSPGQQISADVWAASFERGAAEWDVPLIRLQSIGVEHDEEGLITVRDDTILPLMTGAEAIPFLDRQNQVVYKLFDLKQDGSLGKRLEIQCGEHEIEVSVTSAFLKDTLEKLALLNKCGGLPTEIVGLSEDGDYLIAKQPVATESNDFEADRSRAVEALKGVALKIPGLRSLAILVWDVRSLWIVSDLHERNIMIDSDGEPTIIDALVGAVPPSSLRKNSRLRKAAHEAECLRQGLAISSDDFESVNDDEL